MKIYNNSIYNICYLYLSHTQDHRAYCDFIVTILFFIDCSFAKSHLNFCNAMDYSTPGFPVLHYLPEFAQTHVQWVSDAIQPSHLLPSLFSPASFPPSSSIFPSIRVFSNESALYIRWLKYWSFSFSISPSNEYSGLIFFRADCSTPN